MDKQEKDVSRRKKITKAALIAAVVALGCLVLLWLCGMYLKYFDTVERNNTGGYTWKWDFEFLGIEGKNFKPEKMKSQDEQLWDDVLSLLNDRYDCAPYDELENDIDISREWYDKIAYTDYDTGEYTRGYCLNQYYVIEHDDTAVVSYHGTKAEDLIELSSDITEEFYKGYNFDKIYLIKQNGKWTVTEVRNPI